MDDNFVWCALIIAMAYVFGKTFPKYMVRLGRRERSRLESGLESINVAVDDNEQVMLGMGGELEKLQSDVAGHLTRLDDAKKAFEKLEDLVGLHDRRLDGHFTRLDDIEEALGEKP
jgi:hypothetical protein